MDVIFVVFFDYVDIVNGNNIFIDFVKTLHRRNITKVIQHAESLKINFFFMFVATFPRFILYLKIVQMFTFYLNYNFFYF